MVCWALSTQESASPGASSWPPPLPELCRAGAPRQNLRFWWISCRIGFHSASTSGRACSGSQELGHPCIRLCGSQRRAGRAALVVSSLKVMTLGSRKHRWWASPGDGVGAIPHPHPAQTPLDHPTSDSLATRWPFEEQVFSQTVFIAVY